MDGEIRDSAPVSEAIARVVKRTRARSKGAYVAVANQRVVVRHIDLPFMPDKEFRSAIRFQVADHIPMPIEDAELDHRVVEEYVTRDDQHMMRVQLMAAANGSTWSSWSSVSLDLPVTTPARGRAQPT